MLRIAFDMDGVLADFTSVVREIDARLRPSDERTEKSEAEERGQLATAFVEAAVETEAHERIALALEQRRRREAIWAAIRSTRNFWETLPPITDGVVGRIHEMMLRHRWEVFFITQRPATEGETVQRQTQRWLVTQGFDLPSVLVIPGSRGAAARALRLDYHVDDSAQNCIDVVSDSKATPILIVPDGEDATVASARQLGISTVASVTECLDILEKASINRSHPGLLQRFAASLGWK